MPTFYANSAGAQGTGDGSSEANACTVGDFLTNDAGLHTPLVAGSTCWLKNGTTITFTGDGTQEYLVAAVNGTGSAPIRLAGYQTTIGDGGIVDFEDTQAGGSSSSNAIDLLNAGDHWIFENLRFTGCRRGIDHLKRACMVKNCHAITCYNAGFESATNTSDPTVFLGCSVSDAPVGFDMGAARNAHFIDCVAIGCTTRGFGGGSVYGSVFVRCLAHACNEGFYTRDGDVVVNCAANGCTGSGFRTITTKGITVYKGCTSTNNGAYGLQVDSAKIIYAEGCAFNPTNHQNTSGATDLAAGTQFFESDPITGDPQFLNPLPATDTDIDLSVAKSSSLIGALDQGLAYGQQNNTTTAPDAGVSQSSGGPGGGSGGWL
jgi:hypothetical protein